MSGVKGRSGRQATPWAEALRLVVNERDADGKKLLRVLAERTLDLALAGDMDAVREIANRLDGKPAQQIRLADEDGGNLAAGIFAAFEAAALRARQALPMIGATAAIEVPALLPSALDGKAEPLPEPSPSCPTAPARPARQLAGR